jgi:ATP-dependent exoDNAse (exonuclease V) beta subunit
VTLLAEYARCPRRPWLARAGVVERAYAPGAAQDDPGRATARGTLAHALLAEVDLAAPPLSVHAQLAATASRRGHDPQAPGVRRIVSEVARFLSSPGGRGLSALAAAGRVQREVPFLLRLEAGGRSCYLAGAIDALLDERAGLTVVDFKYALPRPGALERYRGQLLAYCVAARRARPGRRVRARLQFLRGPCSAVELAPSARDLDDFERAAPALAAAAAGLAPPPEPPALGRTPDACAADACGYAHACHGARR